VVGAIGLLVVASLAAIALKARAWGPAFIALYWRTSPSRLLDHPVRAAILELVRSEPGIARAALQRRLQLADGQVEYHVRRLERAGIVVRLEVDGARRLYAAGEHLPVITPLTQRILDALAGEAATARTVAERVGVTPQHARYHLEKMRQTGMIHRSARGARSVYSRALE
jgi:predicted transcriptional regulator